MSDAALLEAAAALAPRVRPLADAIESARRLPVDLVEDLARAGLFRMLVPRALGGGEVAPATMVRAIETLARADSAAGWCVMVGATTGMMSAFLEEDAAREIFADPLGVMSGVFAPMGQAVEEGSGYRVSGRWSFASGIEHSAHRMGGVVLMGPNGPLPSPTGEPALTHAVFRAEQTAVADTWSVSGLRGTGSHDMVVEGALVPRRFCASLGVDRPRHDGVLYRFPIYGLLALGVAGVALGIAREAIVELTALATVKRPAWGRRAPAQRELVQMRVAEAEALVRSARAFLFDATAEVTEIAANGDVTEKERALLRLAATHATRSAARAVDRMYEAGGGAAIYATSPLQRHLRDVHVATQHVMVAEAMYAVVGKVLLGVGDARML